MGRSSWMKAFLTTVVIMMPIAIMIPSMDGMLTNNPRVFAHEGPREPVIRIELPETGEVSVEPGDHGVISLNGRLYCEMPPSSPPGQSCIVELNAEVNGFPVAIPSAMTFDRMTTVQDFIISAKFPTGTSAEMIYSLLVFGRWSFSPGTLAGNVDPKITNITVKPYSLPTLTCVNSKLEVPVGEWKEVKVVLKNEGNMRDNITLGWSKPSNFEVDMDKGVNLEIGMGSSEFLVVKVRQKIGGPANSTISFYARGIHPGKNSTGNLDIIFESKVSITSFVTTPQYLMIGALLSILLIIGILVLIKVRHRKKRRAILMT